jgi:hypothetical protein
MFEIILGIGAIGAIGGGGRWLYNKYNHEPSQDNILKLTYHNDLEYDRPVTMYEIARARFYDVFGGFIYSGNHIFDDILLGPEAEDITAEDLEIVSRSIHEKQL